jgi:hypothetical protein
MTGGRIGEGDIYTILDLGEWGGSFMLRPLYPQRKSPGTRLICLTGLRARLDAEEIHCTCRE